MNMKRHILGLLAVTVLVLSLTLPGLAQKAERVVMISPY